MNTPIPTLSFETVDQDDLVMFIRQKDKIISAVIDRLERHEDLTSVQQDEDKTRLAKECVRIFAENFTVTMKYRLAPALLDYLEWLREFLRYRNFPPSFVPLMISAMKTATHAFMEENNCNDICGALRLLKEREKAIVQEVRV
ncbi:MAG: hypothetical protein KFH87_07500 [Bacteroidetes bacterium]|nr:hypothetical protein [Bacteroidota bacterium]